MTVHGFEDGHVQLLRKHREILCRLESQINGRDGGRDLRCILSTVLLCKVNKRALTATRKLHVLLVVGFGHVGLVEPKGRPFDAAEASGHAAVKEILQRGRLAAAILILIILSFLRWVFRIETVCVKEEAKEG